MYDLLYCSEGHIRLDAQKKLKSQFHTITIRDASDDVHRERIEIILPDEFRKQYLEFLVDQGLMDYSINVKTAMMTQTVNTAVLLEILNEREKADSTIRAAANALLEQLKKPTVIFNPGDRDKNLLSNYAAEAETKSVKSPRNKSFWRTVINAVINILTKKEKKHG